MRELGESVNVGGARVELETANATALQEVLAEASGCRGRQQRIIWLETRVRELEAQLALYGIAAAVAARTPGAAAAAPSDPLENFSGATALGLDLLGVPLR